MHTVYINLIICGEVTNINGAHTNTKFYLTYQFYNPFNYSVHTYAVLHLLCDRFIFGFLRSRCFSFTRILISIVDVVIDGVQHQLYNLGYIVSC